MKKVLVVILTTICFVGTLLYIFSDKNRNNTEDLNQYVNEEPRILSDDSYDKLNYTGKISSITINERAKVTIKGQVTNSSNDEETIKLRVYIGKQFYNIQTDEYHRFNQFLETTERGEVTISVWVVDTETDLDLFPIGSSKEEIPVPNVLTRLQKVIVLCSAAGGIYAIVLTLFLVLNTKKDERKESSRQ